MTYLELLILAVSLCFDTFAVSVGGGISLPNIKFSKKAMIIAFFGVFQAAYLFAGWFVGGKFANVISEWDHWVAFVILIWLGGKMVYGFFKKGDEDEEAPKKSDFLCVKKLAVLATATSIDAVAVGASLALVQIGLVRIAFTTVATFLSTAAAAYIGLQFGKKLGSKVGSKAELLGGVVLIIIGMKILIEHVGAM